MSREGLEEYRIALKDLTENSKPQINMLTMLADEMADAEGRDGAKAIVDIIESRISQVSPATMKLYALYLLDSIVKNSHEPNQLFRELFADNLPKTFLQVFVTADERTRASLYRLRSTWSPFFPSKLLYKVDKLVHGIDPAWPMVEPEPSDRNFSPSSSSDNVVVEVDSPVATTSSSRPALASPTIHVNPKFLAKKAPAASSSGSTVELQAPPVGTQVAGDAQKAPNDPATVNFAERRRNELRKLMQERMKKEEESKLARKWEEVAQKQQILEAKEKEIEAQKLAMKKQANDIARSKAAAREPRHRHKTVLPPQLREHWVKDRPETSSVADSGPRHQRDVPQKNDKAIPVGSDVRSSSQDRDSRDPARKHGQAERDRERDRETMSLSRSHSTTNVSRKDDGKAAARNRSTAHAERGRNAKATREIRGRSSEAEHRQLLGASSGPSAGNVKIKEATVDRDSASPEMGGEDPQLDGWRPVDRLSKSTKPTALAAHGNGHVRSKSPLAKHGQSPLDKVKKSSDTRGRSPTQRSDKSLPDKPSQSSLQRQKPSQTRKRNRSPQRKDSRSPSAKRTEPSATERRSISPTDKSSRTDNQPIVATDVAVTTQPPAASSVPTAASTTATAGTGAKTGTVSSSVEGFSRGHKKALQKLYERQMEESELGTDPGVTPAPIASDGPGVDRVTSSVAPTSEQPTALVSSSSPPAAPARDVDLREAFLPIKKRKRELPVEISGPVPVSDRSGEQQGRSSTTADGSEESADSAPEGSIDDARRSPGRSPSMKNKENVDVLFGSEDNDMRLMFRIPKKDAADPLDSICHDEPSQKRSTPHEEPSQRRSAPHRDEPPQRRSTLHHEESSQRRSTRHSSGRDGSHTEKYRDRPTQHKGRDRSPYSTKDSYLIHYPVMRDRPQGYYPNRLNQRGRYIRERRESSSWQRFKTERLFNYSFREEFPSPSFSDKSQSVWEDPPWSSREERGEGLTKSPGAKSTAVASGDTGAALNQDKDDLVHSPRQPAPSTEQQPSVLAEDILLEQLGRLLNAAEHRLKSGEITREAYDDIVKGLHQIPQLKPRRATSPPAIRPAPRRPDRPLTETMSDDEYPYYPMDGSEIQDFDIHTRSALPSKYPRSSGLAGSTRMLSAVRGPKELQKQAPAKPSGDLSSYGSPFIASASPSLARPDPVGDGNTLPVRLSVSTAATPLRPIVPGVSALLRPAGTGPLIVQAPASAVQSIGYGTSGSGVPIVAPNSTLVSAPMGGSTVIQHGGGLVPIGATHTVPASRTSDALSAAPGPGLPSVLPPSIAAAGLGSRIPFRPAPVGTQTVGSSHLAIPQSMPSLVVPRHGTAIPQPIGGLQGRPGMPGAVLPVMPTAVIARTGAPQAQPFWQMHRLGIPQHPMAPPDPGYRAVGPIPTLSSANMLQPPIVELLAPLRPVAMTGSQPPPEPLPPRPIIPVFQQSNPAVRTPSPHGSDDEGCVVVEDSPVPISKPAGAPSLSTEAVGVGANSELDIDRPQVIPSNKNIFVDGRAYEVQFIGEVAVIERNGLPHRIFFVGPPRDVVIDGVAHRLAFGEQKLVTIDGQTHALMFGAPARELMLGAHPLRGSFGGPSIHVKINSIEHKIQLCGPPPEVKIDPEPDYELYRFMPNQQRPIYRPMYESNAIQTPLPALAQQSQIQAQPGGHAISTIDSPEKGMKVFHGPMAGSGPSSLGPTASGSLDVRDLVRKLVGAGLLTKSATRTGNDAVEAGASGSKTVTAEERPQPRGPRTAFISHGVEPTERRARSTRVLKEFNMRDLRVRYQSEIEGLYLTGLQCTMCGLRYSEGDQEKYSRHLDWHFQSNRRGRNQNSRRWYMIIEDWVNYDEMGEEAAKAKNSVFESLASNQPSSGIRHGDDDIVISTESVLPAADGVQECEVCGEPLEQFWDEDEDSWKIRNAMEVDGKIYHPLCYQDVSQSSVTDVSSGDASPPSFAHCKSLPALPNIPDNSSINQSVGIKIKEEESDSEPPPAADVVAPPLSESAVASLNKIMSVISRAASSPALSSMAPQPITTIAPSTTATAVADAMLGGAIKEEEEMSSDVQPCPLSIPISVKVEATDEMSEETDAAATTPVQDEISEPGPEPAGDRTPVRDEPE